MDSRNRLFDDMAKVAGGAAGTFTGLKAEFDSRLRQMVDDLVGKLDLVTRAELDAALAVAAKAREEQEALALKVAALEEAVAKLTTDK